MSEKELDPRHVEVLWYLANGYTREEIVKNAYLSYWTVQYYIKQAKIKSGTRTLSQLMAWSVGNGYLVMRPDGTFRKTV